jgi:F0F1-type ATP synthase gamma subunit
MKTVKEAQADLQTLHDFHDLIETYEEIAAIRMRKVKKSVLMEREFLKGLSDVFRFVEMAYDTFLIKLGEIKKGKRHFLKTNNKNVRVLLSANMGLYGEIVRKTIYKFIDDVKSGRDDVVIVGKRGKQVFDILVPGRAYQYFDFADSGTDDENMRRILDYVLQYRNIYVYHGLFQSILQQKTTVNNITGDISKFAGYEEEENPQSKKEVENPKFGFFEPSIEEVAAFFETQTLSVIFEQAMNESSLSKFASRMVTLDKAVSNVNDEIKKTNFNIKKLKHRNYNKKQITLYASVYAMEGQK